MVHVEPSSQATDTVPTSMVVVVVNVVVVIGGRVVVTTTVVETVGVFVAVT